MLDYSAIAALAAVIETQSFQAAAEKLFITQSAVSQRIKSLENNYGEPLLVRTQPYRCTNLGQILLKHFKRIVLMENAVNEELDIETHQQQVSIAISRDSLETWFMQVIHRLKKIMPLSLEIIADDQDVTFKYFQNGLVSACASTEAKSLAGCQVDFLGYFDYVLVASPEFKKRYFKNEKDYRGNFLKAPAIIFDNKDKLHAHYLKDFFHLNDFPFPYHTIPSVAGFRQFALKGYAYALIPEMDILVELKQQKLVKLYPHKTWQMPVYWHHWAIETQTYKKLNKVVVSVGKNILRQP